MTAVETHCAFFTCVRQSWQQFCCDLTSLHQCFTRLTSCFHFFYFTFLSQSLAHLLAFKFTLVDSCGPICTRNSLPNTNIKLPKSASIMPGKGQVAWDSVDAWEKLVAAIFATGIKVQYSLLPRQIRQLIKTQVDISSVATHFGATYDTIENRLRPVKRRAKGLQEAVRDGKQVKVTSSRKSPSKPPRTPKKSAAALECELKAYCPLLQKFRSTSC